MLVHLLCTVRKEELLPATLLVFKTLRTGFPTADVTAHLNNWHQPLWDSVNKACDDAKVNRTEVVFTNHHEWITRLIETENVPFVISDTDVIYWKSVEDWNFGGALLAGRYTPQFFDRFANAITRPRLHTSLLWVDPVKVREAVAKYSAQFPNVYCTPRPTLRDLIYPRYTPFNHGTLFHDTCSLLWEAVHGVQFTNDQFDAYEHLQCGTLSDLVSPCYPELRMRETQFAIYENPELARGSWKVQDAFYAKHAC